MKYNKITSIAIFLVAFLMTGCDFLDCDESDTYSKEDVFESYKRAKQMVTNVYSYLPSDFCELDGAMQDAATDDAVHVYKTSKVERFNDGTWSANHLVDDVWGKYYEGIRAANIYLEESEHLDFSDWEYADDYQDIILSFEKYPYEVRFLRAFFYFELIKRYQNVPLVTTILTESEANTLESTPCIKIMDFIMTECTEIAPKLPINYLNTAEKERGRITRAAALALKARVALYKASPLYTGGNDVNLWKAAAKASYDIIANKDELGCRLRFFNDLFVEGNNKNPENILCRSVGETGDFEKKNYPMGVEGGKTSTCPSENLVGCFEMKDGSEFDWNNPAMKANPYKDRDPRLALTIAYNGMSWPKSPVEIYEGGKNGLPIKNATLTGYYLAKYLNKNISFASGSKNVKKHHNWVIFRYAEVLLNYAEAMINAYGDPEFTSAEFPLSARAAVNQVRQRDKIKMPPLPAGLSKDEFIKRLKKERRVELAFEGHRFWDLRRWKELHQATKIYGVSIKKEGSTMLYTKKLVEERVFDEKMYWYPISDKELVKNKAGLKQNPGW